MNVHRIRLLPEAVSRKLAAGEVITRPASVVKELLENALDAGARRITVELRAGGRNLIRVSDNGWGMTLDDLRLAVQRHATSKLETVEDLRHLTSYGFRGEALASIAAVSRLRIETNAAEDTAGCFLVADGGEVKEIGEVARPRGTTVTVQALFYNLPVRRGFLKSDNHETRLVTEVVKEYALAHIQVHFELRADGDELLVLPPVSAVKDRLVPFVDPQVEQHLLQLNAQHPLLSLSGYLADPFALSGSYPLQLIFINQRPVRSRVVMRAVYEGYGRTLHGGNPVFLLFLSTAPENLDVNIHPTKQEVRFVDERLLFDFISEAVRKTLGVKLQSTVDYQELAVAPLITDSPTLPQGFWQLHDSFIFAQVQSGYCIIDQHAAHERILFEELLRTPEHIPQQGLLFPLTVELTAEEFAVYQEVNSILASFGVQTKPFSGQTIVIEALPAGANMGRDDVRSLFAELVTSERGERTLRERLARAIACKGAVKAGQRLSQTEMESLINRLFACREPFFCPHGRPAIIRITLDDLAKRFGRT